LRAALRLHAVKELQSASLRCCIRLRQKQERDKIADVNKKKLMISCCSLGLAPGPDVHCDTPGGLLLLLLSRPLAECFVLVT
jgi:hypothetical protein